jgi:hypothetical protein
LEKVAKTVTKSKNSKTSSKLNLTIKNLSKMGEKQSLPSDAHIVSKLTE